MTSIPKVFWQAGVLTNYSFAAEPEGGGIPCHDSDWSSAGRAVEKLRHESLKTESCALKRKSITQPYPFCRV